MSMRPIELQFALHKNDEVGLKQNQLNHKPVQDQAQLADASLKQAEKERQSIMKTDDLHPSSVTDREKNKSTERGKTNRKGKRNSASDDNPKSQAGPSDHPFKGKHVDLSL
jgi:hypothetical protein